MPRQRKLVFATANIGKLREAEEILGDGFELVSLNDVGITQEIPETGNSLTDNSLQKALFVHNRTKSDCFSDDTGLEVDILGGEPGIHTARYASGEGQDSKANMAKLLREMRVAETEASFARLSGVTALARRTARFRTVVTLILNGNIHFFEGTVEGVISREGKGTGGFGYDPVFIPLEIPGEKGILVPNEEGLSMAEISPRDKNLISHRGRALRKMADFFRKI